jgi:hypothetical protein
MKVRQRTPPATKKLVWRITPEAPKGKWVDPVTIVPAPADEVPEGRPSSWAMSSFDLQYGADVSDVSDTVPAALLDELFPPKVDAPKTSKK